MRKLYEKNTANYPRLKTDRFFVDYDNRTEYTGFVTDAFDFIMKNQLLREDLWERFVYQFRSSADNDGGWRGEYWGKMMRGACFVYSHNRSQTLYDLLSHTVDEMIASADAQGRISTFDVDCEFRGWDIWSRKYVLLGMQYFLEICEDEAQKKRIIDSMKGQVDYLLAKLGDKKEGKLPIFKTTSIWRGLNACSVLEPIVRLYNLTGEQKYLDFASYIVGVGGTEVVSIFKLALKNELPPYQYPVIKAYEMISCFEGLLEYYRVVGEEWQKEALINFAERILETDFTVIGSCGCEHELFDHSTIRQADPTNHKLMQETCVTVTVMKFMYQMHLLTGDAKYADAFETSFYNAYIGALNTELVIEPTLAEKYPDLVIEALPFDSYVPLTVGTRGRQIGGLQRMADKHYYGCCACIGSAGLGLVPKMQLLSTAEGFALNLYLNGTVTSMTPAGKPVTFVTETTYPKSGRIHIALELEGEEEFTVLLRCPAWSKATGIAVNGNLESAQPAGYAALRRTWKKGDVIDLVLDMRTEAILPISYPDDILMINMNGRADYCFPKAYHQSPETMHHVALRRGPLMLSQESRLGYDPEEPVEIAIGKDGYVDVRLPEKDRAPYEHLLEVEVPLTDGSYMTVTDCSSAGKLWTDESKLAIWMLVK